MKEIWKDIKDYEGLYQISNLGNIKSLFSRGKNKTIICKVHKNTAGYYFKALYKNKKFKNNYIHRLVAETFIPNIENKTQVNHINGIKIDNRVENLEWVTISENSIHSYNNGLSKAKNGNSHYRCKIPNEYLLEIKQNDNKEKIEFYSNKFGVTKRHIKAIINNKKRNYEKV